MADTEKPIVLFDGVCQFCNGAVQFLINHDPKGNIRFAALQSNAGQDLLKKFNLPTNDLQTFILVSNKTYYTRSTAALKTLKYLDGFYKHLVFFLLIPKPLRDMIYKIIAKNRYKWFGMKDECMIPTPDIRKRFLD
ncbi:thiol-disulfide oxidoreductase DCC family protein [Metabacillus arenae]|uniref:Thiol-disulfide oxidoreductase DCC family protein n=1 Tax=Metabacillus arenae TaxID=2771434 RepID=A0A926NMC7_9BACI|nr:thiol-disulfide oxidoreductase DCC family protein [Metabacillus arenae]MBD1382583.1 thiol-disulfide oxidoreductase DCC family protein [Metabacillus arenae]